MRCPIAPEKSNMDKANEQQHPERSKSGEAHTIFSTCTSVWGSIHTFEASPFPARSCMEICTAPGCFGPHGTHISFGVLMKNIASWVLRTGSNSTSLTCKGYTKESKMISYFLLFCPTLNHTTEESSKGEFSWASDIALALTQTAISEPENPSVFWAKLSKSLSVKLWGVSPRCTFASLPRHNKIGH